MTTPSHTTHPQHSAWLARVSQLENEGCTTSDAQSVADVEFREASAPPLTTLAPVCLYPTSAEAAIAKATAL